MIGVAEEGVQLLQERRQVRLDSLPNDLEIHVAIVVNHTVSHRYHPVERNDGKLGAGLWSESRRRFSGDQDKKILARLAGYVALNRLERAHNVQQVSALARRQRSHGSFAESIDAESRF